MNIIILFSVLFSLNSANASQGFNDLSGLIVGGQVVLPDDPIAKSTVGVFANGAFCTGSIIDVDLVVTAAHCLSGPVSGVKIVYGGEIFSSSPHPESPAASYEVNSLYKGPQWEVDWGDIALIRIQGKLLNNSVPAEILSVKRPLVATDQAVLAGYGINDVPNYSGSGTLRKATVAIVVPQIGKTEVAVDSSHGSGACHGDSGGPAFLPAEQGGHGIQLWGVTSHAYPNSAPDDCAEGAVYTNIVSYLDWIQQAATRLRQQN